MDLEQWLAHIEALHTKPIDMGLDRIRNVWASLQKRYGLKQNAVVINVGGTNGKGSTCAMLEAILMAGGFKVGLHTSPHLKHFSERARINGQNASNRLLEEGFAAVEAVRGDVTLSYFEFGLLAILYAFHASELDVWIMEIGLGGRLDAVNMLEPDCSIVTSIDIDHAALLGDSREKIGWEKAHIYRTGKPAICSDPLPPQTLVDYAADIDADLWRFGRDFNYQGDKQQWSFAGRNARRNSMAYPALRGANQLLNAAGVLACLEALRNQLPVTQQAVRQGFATVELPGRFQVLPGRPTIILDVAHNPHAVAHLAQNLDNMGFFPFTYAVFGMLNDKDIAKSIEKMRGKIDHWYLCTTQGPRGTTAAQLEALVRAVLGPELNDADKTLRCFDSPSQALAAARQSATENDRIAVFGSFLVVADVL